MITRFVFQRADGDCGIAALAMLLKLPYEDVYIASSLVDKRRRGRRGLSTTDMLAMAQCLGTKLRARRKFDLETAEGILGIYWPDTKKGHWTTLLDGRIFDPADGEISAPDDYFQHNGGKATVLLTDA